MRLILSVDALRPPLTGIGRYTWELVRRLQLRSDLTQLRFFRNGRWVGDPARLLMAPSAETVPATSMGDAPAPAWVRWPRALYWHTTCRYNVFHAPNYFLPVYARHGVVTVHDLSVFKYPQAHPVERVRQFEQRFRSTLALASQLITDSNTVRQEVIHELGWPPERVTAIPLGVGSEYQPRSAAQLASTLATYGLAAGGYTLCVATIEPRKRIDALLAGYRRLPSALRREVPLVLVGGKGWMAERLHEQIESAGAEGWLHYIGYVPAEALPCLYAGARLFAYLSEYEGFGLPVAEAMASGVPVLTSDRSCLPDTAGGAAMLVNPDDVDDVAVKLQQIAQDERWRAGAVAAGLAVTARYSWETCVDETMAVYRRA